MAFKNSQQSKKCFLLKSKGKVGTWDCDEFAKETNGSGLCVVALSKNLKLTTTHSWTITQNPCYVPFFFTNIN